MSRQLDSFGQQAPRRKKSDPDLVWNILTLVMLLGVCCVTGYFLSLYSNPYSALNFFPPNTPLPTVPPPSATPLRFESTWTPTVTITPKPSDTRRPTFTLEPTSTVFVITEPTSNLTPTRTVQPTGVPYIATITYHDSTTFRTDTNCTMLLVAGRALDSKNQPMTGFIVKMGGSLPGKGFTPPDVKLTGLATDYGPSGFEFDTGVEPVDSSQSLWVQLFDQSGAPLSSQTFVTTYEDCKRNLALVTFQQK